MRSVAGSQGLRAIVSRARSTSHATLSTYSRKSLTYGGTKPQRFSTKKTSRYIGLGRRPRPALEVTFPINQAAQKV